MEMIRAHLLIAGKVQGVGYRYHTEQVAKNAGLKGWVRNLQDGRVEAVFEGDRLVVESMIRWCHQGAPAAIVTEVKVAYEPPGNLIDFRTRPTV
jgi:acylphosphatase